ncbi:MAG: NAD-dependent epimerase/dehydratase family protein [Acidobacteriota bacterium]|nr:NAD-dependent epimerase/dehydratase family protein [Acidobacteriota bacterium]
MKVVTGATGYIGGVLVRALADRGDPVRAVFHERSGIFDAPGVEWVRGDVLDRDSMVAAFRDADVVFHLASLVSIEPRMADAMQAVNVAGARNVAEAALECGVRRLIHFSSIRAYDQFPLDEVLDETRGRAGGLSRPAYDRSKALGEDEIRHGVERGLDAVILNPTGVLGPYDRGPTGVGQFFVDLRRRRVPTLISGGFDCVDVRDVVGATLAAETRGRSGENYILGGRWHSVPELARLSEAETRVPTPRFVCPVALARFWTPFQMAWDRLHARPPLYTPDALHHISRSNRRVSSARARDELGFAPRPVRDSVRDAVCWFEENDKLAG